MIIFFQVARGRYSYTSPEGELIEVIWEADENGFRVSMRHPRET